MIQIDLTKATPQDRVVCFGEAFRLVQMVCVWTTPAGEVLTRVILDGRPVTLVGDPEKALAVYMRRYTRWALRRLGRAAWEGFTGAFKDAAAILGFGRGRKP